ncbi:MAG: hypothetical protein ACM3UU_02430 [Ignavibacteriales bacterium]
MKNIEIKKFIMIVTSIVLGFCLIAGIVLWIFIAKQPDQINNQANTNQNGNTAGAATNNLPADNVKTDDTNIAIDSNAQIQGGINAKNINALVKIQRYSLLTDGLYDAKKVNSFIAKNIEQFFPANCTKVDYKLYDLNNDGFNEAALMYEMSNQSDRYLMIATLRWKDGAFYKDVDAELRKNDYNFNTNEIVAGDIIQGGNPEFILIQKDPQGIKSSRAKIIILTTRGFSEFYTVDSTFELEVKDYDNDGLLELYTSLIAGDGNKHMSWKKWAGKDFIEYENKIEPFTTNSEY